jgi:CheY-like chemotaxis protein
MYTLLLVDDEEEVIEAIVKKVKWEELGFQVAGHANNGFKAMDMLEEMQPDVVMTDIRMPYMDGLELCAHIKAKYPATKILLFTGFDDFEYAKEAVHLEIEEYILKPLNAVEITEVFKRLKEKLDYEISEKRNTDLLKKYYADSLPMLQANLYTTLIEGRIPEEEMPHYFKDYQIAFTGPWYCCLIIHTSASQIPEGMDIRLLSVSVDRQAGENLGEKWNAKRFRYLGDTIMIIPRSKGEWKWQKDTISYSNSAGTENVTLYIVSNSKQAYTEIPELVAPRSRYVMIEYDRPAKDYTGWNIYTWNSGFGSDVSVAFADINGKMVAKIPVKDSQADLMLSFCMRQSTTDNEWANKDGGDHYVTIPAGQSLVKAVFTQGEGITEVLPYNAGYEMDGANDTIHFYYRNDTLAAENNLASLDGKVSVVVNGQTCPMTYDAANDRFGYDFTGVSTGDYYYYYVVDGTEELDAFNSEKADYSGKECSVCHFKKANMSVAASLSQYAMDYNDNNVLSVKLTAKDGEGLETSEIAAITADLSELGLNREFAIDPTLMEGTISCLNTVAAGEKTIPVTVKDIYGNVYTTATNVTVTERKKSAGDFDWDEAVIYFAVTDRFFDGDAENNDAYGVGDYNIGEKGGSSYHG